MLQKADQILTKIENALTGSLFLGALAVLAWNIFMRKVFHSASTWAEEAIRYAIIWVTFVGSSQCAKAGNHVGIDIVVEMFPVSLKKYVNALADFFAAVFCIFCVYTGCQIAEMTALNGTVSSAMQMPMWILYISIPLGFGLTALRFCIAGIQVLRGKNTESGNLTDEEGKLDMSKM